MKRRIARTDAYPSAYLPSVCRSLGLPIPVPEYRFSPPRRWRFDWAWPDHLIAIEVEGGVWINGRHTRGAGFLKDAEKYNRAACLGWRILRYTPQGLAGCLPDLAMVLK